MKYAYLLIIPSTHKANYFLKEGLVLTKMLSKWKHDLDFKRASELHKSYILYPVK